MRQCLARHGEDTFYHQNDLIWAFDTKTQKLNALVKTQSFIEGKAAHMKPFQNVYKEVNASELTGKQIYLLNYARE